MTSGRVYTVTIAGVASPAAIFDLFEINPGSNKPLQLIRLKIGQTGEPTTEEENLMVTVVVGHTTSGSGGSAPTPGRTARTDAAAGFTAETMNTTIASGGTTETLAAFAVNMRSGDDIPLSPEEALQSATERIVVRCSAPADAVTIVATLWVEELG